MKDPEKQEVLRKCCAMLAEHFSAVQILAEEYTPQNETSMHQFGSGSWYSRVGMTATFLDRHKADSVGEFVKRHSNDE